MNRLDSRANDWRDDPETDRRVEALVAELSPDEKVDLVTGDLNFSYAFYNAPIERLGIPALTMADGPAGVRVNDRSVNGGRSTALPAPIGLAATWEPDLARRYGDVIGAEAFATGHNVHLAPAVDIARASRGGRTFESFGEDPLLQSRMVVPEIEGIQAHPVEATIKHFIANNQEYRRFTIDARVDERALREIYLPPFEAAIVDGAVGAAMASFNLVNGTYASEHGELLTELLRGELGFRGWVMSDYEATWSTVESATAGLDQEQPSGRFWGERLAAAVSAGEVPMTTLDEMVRHILRPMIGLGLLDHPVEIDPLPVEAHADTARAIAEEGIVLLKNDDGLLPLDPVPGSIAVIGPEADNGLVTGAGSGWRLATRDVSPLEGITRRAGPRSRVAYAPGVDPLSAAVLLPGPPAIPSAFLAPPAGAGGRGLRAEYWSNPTFDGEPILTRIEPQAAINLGFFNIPVFNAISPKLAPTPMELNGRVSVRWTGTLTASVTGEHELALTGLGSATLFIDDQPTIQVESAGPAEVLPAFPPPPPLVPDVGPIVETATVHLVAGEPRAIQVDYAADSAEQNEQIGAQLRLGWRPPAGTIPPLVREAAALAASCDVAIVVAPTYESEMMDRPDLHLPAEQDLLIREVAAANPRTTVVLMSGGPVDVSDWAERVPAILEAWYAGQEQGDAIARVLFGDVNPSGRLPITFPMDEAHTPIASPEQYPGVDGAVHYREGILVGYRGYDELGIEPRYPFGHGLSYSSFEFDGLALSALPLEAGADPTDRGADAIEVSFELVNTGTRRATEVAQVYVGRLPGVVPTPQRQLAGFVRLALDPDERARASVAVKRRSLSWWDTSASRWTAASGEVEIEVGASSRDIRLRGVVRIAE